MLKRMSEMQEEEEKDHVDENLNGGRGYEESKDPSQHRNNKGLTSQIQKIFHITPQVNESPFTFKNVFERRDDKRILL